MTTLRANASAEIRIDVWADCPDGWTLDEFERHLRDDLDNPVLSVDRENRRILMATTSPKDS